VIKLELPVDSVNFLLNALSELPIKSNAHLLIIQIKEQADPQVQENNDGNN